MYGNTIEYEVTSRYALFSEPVTRLGGEKFSYPVPTYEALKGITDSIYWKPTIIWVIDKVRVMNKVATESKGVRINSDMASWKPDLERATYLHDVRYQVSAHFEWNRFRSDMQQDHETIKHQNSAIRALAVGGRRDIFLGTRECQGYVEPCVFGEGKSFYDDYGTWDLGYMFHSFIYPDKNDKHELSVGYWHPIMTDGIIEFPRPESESIDRRVIRTVPTSSDTRSKKTHAASKEER